MKYYKISYDMSNTQEHIRDFNPFPGLRPFTIEESHLFFGRKGQSEELVKKLNKNRFVAVMGASGSGKSSLIHCGLVPILSNAYIPAKGENWKVVNFRPGSDPVRNLAEGLVKKTGNVNGDEGKETADMLSFVLEKSPKGLIEAVRMLRKDSGDNFFILVDQFEELFRYRRESDNPSGSSDSEAFVKLLVEAVHQVDEPI